MLVLLTNLRRIWLLRCILLAKVREGWTRKPTLLDIIWYYFNDVELIMNKQYTEAYEKCEVSLDTLYII